MRLALLLLLVAAPAVAAPAPFAKPARPDRTDHLRPFRGEWKYLEWRGRIAERSSWFMHNVRLSILGDQLRCYAVGNGVLAREATIRIDAKRSVSEGDVSFVMKDGTRLGIYKIDGDVITIRTSAPGKPRPSSYAIEGDGDDVLILSRSPLNLPRF